MSALVQLHHNEPMTTSLAFAACTQNEHDSVILLIRKFADDIAGFGELSFSIAPDGISRFEIGNSVWEVDHCRNKRGRPTEFAWLNEGQSLFLLTLMRNSPVVVEFKKALIRAFLTLRDQARAGALPAGSAELPSPAHRADNLVAADRCFRAALRSSRAIGYTEGEARRLANRLTRERTGIDLAAELGRDLAPYNPAQDARDRRAAFEAFFAGWCAGHIAPVDHAPPLSQPYWTHVGWAREHGLAPLDVREFYAALDQVTRETNHD